MAKTPDDIHREILKEALKGKEEKPAFLQKSKKAIIIAMALFLILVTLIYLLPGTAIDYLRASFSTYTIEDSMIFLPQGRSIAFENWGTGDDGGQRSTETVGKREYGKD